MTRAHMAMAALIGMAGTFATNADAATVGVHLTGPGVSGSLVLTYGAATDSKYPGAYEVTGISGTFSDSNNGNTIVDAPVGPLVAITHATPELSNLLAPHDFSRFAVASGLPPQNNGFLTYDNLFWPGGSPQTASDYPASGGFLDIYGLMFSIGGGMVVDFWSNGLFPGQSGPVGYGVAVATSAMELDYVGGVTASAPEPSTWAMIGVGFACLAMAGCRAQRKVGART